MLVIPLVSLYVDTRDAPPVNGGPLPLQHPDGMPSKMFAALAAAQLRGGRPCHVITDDPAVLDQIGEIADLLHIPKFHVDSLPGWTHAPRGDVLGWVRPGYDQTHLAAPIAVFGDVHGQYDTLVELIGRLDQVDDGHLLVSVGDLVDKDDTGQGSVDTLRWAMAESTAGRLLVVRGNHEDKLLRRLKNGRPETTPYGHTDVTVDALRAQPDADTLLPRVKAWLDRLPVALQFPDAWVVHAALDLDRLCEHGFESNKFRSVALYGQKPPKGEPQYGDDGWPIRLDWAAAWDGPRVVHGHVCVDDVDARNDVINVDTAAYAGGALSAWLSATGTTVSVHNQTYV